MKRKRKRLVLTQGGHYSPSSVTGNSKAKLCDSSLSNLTIPSSSLSCSPTQATTTTTTTTTTSLTTHHRPLEEQQQHLRPQRPRRRHVCLHCNRFFTFLPFFLYHLRMRHRPIHCKKCCKYFVFRSVYIRHTLLVHGSRLRRKSSSMDSDLDSLASSTSSTMTKPGGVAGRKTCNSRLAWLYSPDTFDFVCPYCFYESFNEHDIRTHVHSCHWKNPQHLATKMSPALEALKQLGAKDSPIDRETAESPPKTVDKDENPSFPRRDYAQLKRSLVDRSPKITKISRKTSREEHQHSKPSFSGDFIRHLPSAFDVNDNDSVSNSHSRHDSDCVDRVGRISRLSLPEKSRTRAADDDVLGVDRRRSGDLFEIGADKGSSLAEPEAKRAESLNLPPPKGITSAVIDDLTEKENRRKSLDLASIDQRVDFSSSEGMGSFLKEVIDFLSDGTEDADDAPDNNSHDCSSPSSAETKSGDVLAEIGVTRIRSKRIACQQQKVTAAKGDAVESVSPKKIVEFVSLEDENEEKSSTALPLTLLSAPTIKLEKKSSVSDLSSDKDLLNLTRPKKCVKKFTSDIQKMLLAYSCDSLGYLIMRPSQFIPTGFSCASTPTFPGVSPKNPFAISGIKSEDDIPGITSEDDISPDLSTPALDSQVLDRFPSQTQVSSTKRKRREKRKRHSTDDEVDPGLLEMILQIGSCQLEDVAGAIEGDVERDGASIARTYKLARKNRTISKEDEVAIGVRTLRKRVVENGPATEANQQFDDVKPSIVVSMARGTTKTVNSEVTTETCCNKPLTTSKANRLRNETNPLVQNALKPVAGAKDKLGDPVVKRTKNGSGQSLKENNSGTQQSEPDWYWPPKVNDMVVGLFEDGWYIGKALEITAKGDKVKIKFMEDRNFKVTQRFWKWPRVNDVQVLVKCSILNVSPEVKLLDKAKGECTKNLAGGVYEVTNLTQIQARANEFYKKKRPTAPDVT